MFAFAKPFIPFNQKEIVRNNKAISIFIDNSLSMSQLGKEGQLLEVAKNKAKGSNGVMMVPIGKKDGAALTPMGILGKGMVSSVCIL